MREINGAALTRRGFFSASLAGLAAAAGQRSDRRTQAGERPPLWREAAVPEPRVIVSRAQSPSFDGNQPRKEMVRELLVRSVTQLSGERTAQRALAALLGLESEPRVGIKINVLGGRSMMTSPELAECLVEELESAGVRREQIVIWDRKDTELQGTGWPVNRDGEGVRCYGTQPEPGYERKAAMLGGKEIRFSRVLTEQIDVLVNLPVLKTHGIAGVSGALKNHYGSFDLPHRFHDSGCDPHLAELSVMPAVRRKERLIVVDALRPLYDGGPSDKPPARLKLGALMASTNPVAADWVGLGIIEEGRGRLGLPTLSEIGGYPRYLETAARMEFGWPDRKQIQVETHLL